MIKYEIYPNEGGIACKIQRENEETSFITSNREFAAVCDSFIKGGYKVKVKNEDLLIVNASSKMIIRDYESIKDDVHLYRLCADITERVKKEGFVDYSNKDNLSPKVDRHKSKLIPIIAANLAIIISVGGTSLIPDIVAPSAGAAAPKANIEIVHRNYESAKIKESADTMETSPIEQYLESPKVTPEATPDVTPVESEPIMEAYLEFEDKSETAKAAYCRENYYDTFEECARLYGLDAELLFSMATQERGSHSREIDKLGAIGIMQIQYKVWVNHSITYYKLNEETGLYEKESLFITDEMLKDEKMNIHIGAMITQYYLIYDQYNMSQGVQSYNQGHGAVDRIVQAYCDVTGKDFDTVRSDQTDLGWLDYRYVCNWGDPLYLEHVMAWPKTHTFTVINVLTGEPVTFTYTNELTKTNSLS